MDILVSYPEELVECMDVRSELKKVYTNRLLQSQKEISSFEEALGTLIV